MILTGSIYFTTDQQLCVNTFNSNQINTVIICVSGSTNQFPQFMQATGALNASVLTPSYDSFMFLSQGMINEFEASYYTQLLTPECSEYIIAILKALSIGKNILLYCTQDEFESGFMNTIFGLFFNQYGIVIGTQTNPFQYNELFDFIILQNLYNCELIGYLELFEVWALKPFNTQPLLDTTIISLINELQPPLSVKRNTMRDFNNFFNKMAINKLIIPAHIAER